MRKEDKIAMFLTKAIGNPNRGSSYCYLASVSKKSLLRVPVECKSQYVDSYDLVELRSLGFEVKRDFLQSLKEKYSSTKDERLNMIFDSFNEYADLNLERDIKEIDFDLSVSIYFQIGYFLHQHIEVQYEEFEIDDSWDVEFHSDLSC